jgi:hypothetical protein
MAGATVPRRTRTGMKAKKTSVVALLVASMLAACWIVNEIRAARARAGRLNAPSHLRQVGLGFRYEPNDIVGFRMTGDVVVAQTPSAAPK